VTRNVSVVGFVRVESRPTFIIFKKIISQPVVQYYW